MTFAPRFEEMGIHVDASYQSDQRVKCPWCSEQRKKTEEKDLSVNVVTGVFHCFHCERKGHVGEGVRLCQRCMVAAIDRDGRTVCPQCHTIMAKALPMYNDAQRAGSSSASAGSSAGAGGSGSSAMAARTVSTPTRTVAPKPQPLPRVRESSPDEKLYAWFKERGISRAVVKRNRVTATMRSLRKSKGSDEWEPAVWCIAFNYYSGDSIVNAKFRTEDKRWSQTPGGSLIPYKMDDILDERVTSCIITEGELDALTFEEIGICEAISTPHGAIQPDDVAIDGKLQFLEYVVEPLERMEKIFIATDADAPGRRTAQELARRLGKHRCYIVEYPEDCKDANDVLLKHGREALEQCLRDARAVPFEGVITVAQDLNEIMRLYDVGIPAGTKCGFAPFDEQVRWLCPCVAIVTGVPSHGKSTLLDWLFVNLMVNVRWKIAQYTPESYPVEQHSIKLIQQIVGKPFDKNRNGRMTMEEARQALEFLDKHLFRVYPVGKSFGIDEILETFLHLILARGVCVCSIDPWNAIEHLRPRNMSETEYIGFVLNRIRDFARVNSVIFFVVAHPSKMKKGFDKDGRTVVECPTLYDIAGSAHWFNICDIGIVVYREFGVRSALMTDPDKTHVQLHKIRNDYVGKAGADIVLNFEESNRRFFQGGQIERRNMLMPEYAHSHSQIGERTPVIVERAAEWDASMIVDKPF